MNRHCLILAIALGVLGQPINAIASPAPVFLPYLEGLQRQLPPGYELRLPAQILLGGPSLAPEERDRLIVKILPTGSPLRLTISLLTCESSPYPCLVGSFSAESATSITAQQELRRHQALATPITLTPSGVRGYLHDGLHHQPASEFSSLMWQQDSMIYSVRFLATERQNILYMAYSMANEAPIRSSQVSSWQP